MNKTAILSLCALSFVSFQGPVAAAAPQEDPNDISAPPLQRNPHQQPVSSPGSIDAINQPKSVREVEMALRQMETENDVQKKALEAEYEERRRNLLESQEYKDLNRRDRKAKLRALKNEFQVREQQLDEAYRSKKDDMGRRKEGLPEEER